MGLRGVIWVFALAWVGLGCGRKIEGNQPAAGDSAQGLVAGQTTARPESSAVSDVRSDTAVTQPATFVGSDRCRDCHAMQFNGWMGSHHQLAMQVANSATVLGDFEQGTFRYFGETTEFRTSENRFQVVTNGTYWEGQTRREGRRSFDVPFVFGVEPIQQYLIDVGSGRLQTLPWSFDTRTSAAGGQRWYHLYPDEPVRQGDALHWSAPLQNWNSVCADCHSTNLQKNYRPESDSYSTSYSEISVGCEACHGPGSAHVDQARSVGLGGGQFDAQKGLRRALVSPQERRWQFREGRSIAELVSLKTHQKSTQSQLSACAKCHSRRSDLGGDSLDFDDRYRLALLEQALYFPDGQIQDEVYVYGSFLQSKMHAKGVVCGDCHDPHSAKLRADGNQLCATCHSGAVYNSPKHHFHPEASPGAQCVSCHMPSRTYMGIDARRDHRFGLPRPDLSLELGVPNACTDGCHQPRAARGAQAAARWASEEIRRRLGEERPPTFAFALAAARRRDPGGALLLQQVSQNKTYPAIVRASALLEMRHYPGRQPTGLSAYAKEPEPLVRRAAAELARSLSPGVAATAREGILRSLLGDPVRSVRLEAVRGSVELNRSAWSPADQKAYQRGVQELRRSLSDHSDTASAQLDLAWLALNEERSRPAQVPARRHTQAEAMFERALTLDRTFTAAYVNFADYWRERGRDDQAEVLLKSGLDKASDPAQLHHALGLVLVRLKRPQPALEQLALANQLRPDISRFGFVYAVALWEQGKRRRAVDVLEQVHERFAGDRQVLSALSQYHALLGNAERAGVLRRRLGAIR